MKYEYTYRNTAMDLWQVSMSYMYSSMIGVCNVVFTGALIILTVTQWQTAGALFRAALILACLFFPVIQPCMVYRKAGKQASGITQDTTICFDNSGVHIKVGEETSDLKWEKIHRVSKKAPMLIVFSDAAHGFMLMNRIVGRQKNELYQFILSKIKQN